MVTREIFWQFLQYEITSEVAAQLNCIQGVQRRSSAQKDAECGVNDVRHRLHPLAWSDRLAGRRGCARGSTAAGSVSVGLTRNPESKQPAALPRRSVEVVNGDLYDQATLRQALAGVWGVFGVQNTWEAGVEGGRSARQASGEHETNLRRYPTRIEQHQGVRE
jgi:hypothetical protein